MMSSAIIYKHLQCINVTINNSSLFGCQYLLIKINAQYKYIIIYNSKVLSDSHYCKFLYYHCQIVLYYWFVAICLIPSRRLGFVCSLAIGPLVYVYYFLRILLLDPEGSISATTVVLVVVVLVVTVFEKCLRLC